MHMLMMLLSFVPQPVVYKNLLIYVMNRHEYSQRWRFKFGIKKTKCVCIGKSLLPEFKWYLGSSPISKEPTMEILGNVFNENYKFTEHIQSRIRKCRQSFYSLTKCGMAYPGASSDIKYYLWK